MGKLSSALRDRLLPAILTATGVSLIVGGLLAYTGAAELNPPRPSPTIIGLAPTIALPTFPPSDSSSPDASPTQAPNRRATRVVIASLGIDLPVVASPPKDVLCNVAMFATTEGFVQPGIPGSTYIFAHARKGMFLPLLDASRRNHGEAMLGETVDVYTSDERHYLYLIKAVFRGVPKLTAYDDPFAAINEELWLQTSEGPKGTPTVLQVLATPLIVVPATHQEAMPKPNPVKCE